MFLLDCATVSYISANAKAMHAVFYNALGSDRGKARRRGLKLIYSSVP